MRSSGSVLLAIGAFLLPLTADISADYGDPVQMEGILDPFDVYGVCDWGQTHALKDPCTGEFAYVYSDTTAFDCQYVLVQGTDATNAGYCPLMIAADIVVPVPPPCLIQIRELTVKPVADGQRLNWESFGCADSYDVIRGMVSELSAQDLGAVLCLANDEPLSRVDDLSGDEPLPGECFFYLVRPNGPAGFPHYGHSSSGSTRFPVTGDCPQD